MVGKVSTKTNPVEDFLKEHKGVIYSIRTMKKKLSMSSRKLIYYANNSDFIKHVDSNKVGSNRNKFNIYCYEE